jgi:hypothetical protein
MLCISRFSTVSRNSVDHAFAACTQRVRQLCAVAGLTTVWTSYTLANIHIISSRVTPAIAQNCTLYEVVSFHFLYTSLPFQRLYQSGEKSHCRKNIGLYLHKSPIYEV